MIVELTSLIGVGLIAAGVYSSAKKPKMTAAQVEAATAAAHSRWQGKPGEAAAPAAPPLRRSRRGLVLAALGVVTLAAGFMVEARTKAAVTAYQNRDIVPPSAAEAFGPDLAALLAKREHDLTPDQWGEITYTASNVQSHQTVKGRTVPRRMIAYTVKIVPRYGTRDGSRWCYRANIAARVRTVSGKGEITSGEPAATTVNRCFAEPLEGTPTG